MIRVFLVFFHVNWRLSIFMTGTRQHIIKHHLDTKYGMYSAEQSLGMECWCEVVQWNLGILLQKNINTISISNHLYVQFIRWIFMIISCLKKSSCHFCVVFVLLCIVISYDYMSNMTGVLSEAGTAYPSKETGLKRGVFFCSGSMLLIILVFCIFCCCLSSFYALNLQCCQCLWIVHSWLPLTDTTLNICIHYFHWYICDIAIIYY